MVSGFQQMTMNLSKPPAYTLHVLSECAVTPPTMLWSKIMRLHITVAAFLFLLLLSYEFLLFLSFKIPPIARSTTLRHETINKSGT